MPLAAPIETSESCALPADAPKILLLIDGMAALTDGGTERQLLQLASVARRAGLAPSICVLRETRWLTPGLAGCPVHWFSFRSLRSANSLRELLRLFLWMRREHFAILQTFFTDANLLGPLLGRGAGIPVIFGTRRSLNPVGFSTPIAIRMLASLSKRAVTRVLTNAEAVSRDMEVTEGFAPEKLQVIYNGVDIDALQAPRAQRTKVRNLLHLTPGQLLIGNVSGLRPVKRLDIFLRACAQARQRAPYLRFVIVGEGEERKPLEALIGDLNLEDAVTLAGAQEDVRPWLAAMDIAVLCSEAEGFSNSLLEYMAASLPVIATDVGGNREALGEAGMLIAPSDTEELADAMLRFVDRDLRREHGLRARERVERFNLDTAQASMAALYQAHCPQLISVRDQAVHRNAQASIAGGLPRDGSQPASTPTETEAELHTFRLGRRGASD